MEGIKQVNNTLRAISLVKASEVAMEGMCGIPLDSLSKRALYQGIADGDSHGMSIVYYPNPPHPVAST